MLDNFQASKHVIVGHDFQNVAVFSPNNFKVVFLSRSQVFVSPHNNHAVRIYYFDF